MKLMGMAFAFLLPAHILSQDLTHIAVIDKFRSYSGKAYQEKLFLHTDREFYTTGEILWFKIYYVDGAFNKPADLSKVAYVEVLNEMNEPVLQTIASLKRHENNGSLYLPTTLNTGYYTVRAYTSWMRNFDANYFFEKKITVVNTLRAATAVSNKETVAPAVIQFFPEGGNLVNNIKSTIGFTVSDIDGGINDCRGVVIDKNNDTVLSFAPLKFGIGRFELTPDAQNNYKAVVLFPSGKKITAPLPKIYDRGLVMHVKENEKDQFIVSVHRNGDNGTNEEVILAIHSRQVLQFAEKKKIDGTDSTVFIVDKKRVGQGVVAFTVFNGKDQPVCERLCFIKPVNNNLKPEIKTDKQDYTNREQIELVFNVHGNDEYDLSASVFEFDSLQQQGRSDILSYLWLGSDLGGTIESASYYFSDEIDAAIAADNLMLTYGWRRFKWEDVLNGDDSFIKYYPETKGHLVSAKVSDAISNKPGGNITSYLSVSGQPFGFYSAASNKDGLVQFEVKDFYGNRQLTAIPGNEADSIYRVEILRPFALVNQGRKLPPLVLNENIKELLLQKSIGMQVQNIFSGDSIRNFTEPVINDTLPFFGKGETGYNLDEYKRFTTMEEVLREYVAGVNVGIRNGRKVVKLFDPSRRDFYTDNPLIMIDGVALADPHNIFTYDPLKVKRLDIMSNRYIYGDAAFSGIISLSTYNGTFDAFDLDPKLVAVDYNGLQLQRQFYSPAYATKQQIESKIPDLRNTLFWSPHISTGEDGRTSLQFYSSDRKGKYIVVLQGINSNGELVSSVTTFSVK